jgi:signal transduction histidine kinase
MNLLSNAVKYNLQNGKIEITVKLEQRNQTSYYCFTIHDSGIGISKIKQKKIFQLFGMIKENNLKNQTGIFCSC